MFTGIIQDIGEITAIDKQSDWIVTVAANKLLLDKTAIGASIACSGVCLTVIETKPLPPNNRGEFKVQISAESLSKTTALHWKPGARVNLEPALKMGDELGGHLVSGHIDGIAQVKEKRWEGKSIRYEFEVPAEFAKFVAPKGSIALDGVSLTVNEVKGARFGVNVIPHTLAHTTFDALDVGGDANFEVDLIARYIGRMVGEQGSNGMSPPF